MLRTVNNESLAIQANAAEVRRLVGELLNTAAEARTAARGSLSQAGRIHHRTIEFEALNEAAALLTIMLKIDHPVSPTPTEIKTALHRYNKITTAHLAVLNAHCAALLTHGPATEAAYSKLWDAERALSRLERYENE